MAYREADGAVIDRPEETAWAARRAAPLIVPEIVDSRRELAPPRPARSTLPRCPELDCVRHLLAPAVLAMAELRAAEVGVGADRVLIAQGAIDEETYLKALTRQLGIGFEHLDAKPREACPLGDERLLAAAETGMLPLTVHGNTKVVVAPRELTVRGLLDAIERTPDIKPRIRITSNARLQKFIADRAGDALGQVAAESLRAKRPELSAGTGQRRSIVTAAAVAGIAVFALTAPGIAGLAMETILGLIFLAWTLLRLLGILSLRSVRRATQPIPDNQLPVYSIVVALYRKRQQPAISSPHCENSITPLKGST